MAYEPAKPDYYDLLNKFACLGPVSAGLPVTETLKKAGLVETTTTITASGRALLKNEARRLRPVPPEPSAGTVEYLAGCDKAIRNASGAVVTPSVWAEMLRDAKVCMLVEGGAVHDLVTWADSGEEVRKVRPELRVRLTELGLQAVEGVEHAAVGADVLAGDEHRRVGGHLELHGLDERGDVGDGAFGHDADSV